MMYQNQAQTGSNPRNSSLLKSIGSDLHRAETKKKKIIATEEYAEAEKKSYFNKGWKGVDLGGDGK